MDVKIFPLTPDEIIPHQQISTRETTGQRGKPEMDFDFLNLIQGEDRSQLGTLQNRAQSQQADLSTILEGVHVTVRKTLEQQRDSD